jgi:hypothetical protein
MVKSIYLYTVVVNAFSVLFDLLKLAATHTQLRQRKKTIVEQEKGKITEKIRDALMWDGEGTSFCYKVPRFRQPIFLISVGRKQ